jgi:hypothetical protein
MAKNLIFAVFLWFTSFSYAQTIKTDVLVIGSTASGTAAAIQSARSKLKTVLLMPGGFLDKTMPAGNIYTISYHPNLASGIWGEFNGKIRAFYKGQAGYQDTTQLKFESYTGATILKGIVDTVKNLTLKLNTPFTSVKKDGTGWEVSITVNGKTNVIKTKVLVDATDGGKVMGKLSAKPSTILEDRGLNLFRTSTAAINTYPYNIPLRSPIVNSEDNLLFTQELSVNKGIEQLPIQLSIGQGVGCIAAYCAFFKTTTKNLNVRIIQQELLDFKGILLPFADIRSDDKYIRALQQIGATGLLKGIRRGNDLLFSPDATITTAEIKPVLNEIYTRAFIWFDKEKPGEMFTVGNTVSLISEFTLTDLKTLQNTLQKDWQAKYGFKNFDATRQITRLEFAVLVNQYLNPFACKIDLEGDIVN